MMPGFSGRKADGYRSYCLIPVFSGAPFRSWILRSTQERKAIGKVGKYLPNPGKAVTLLGDTQWRWLEQQLKQPAELRLIVSSTQIVANEKGMDEWGAFPHERQRLFDLIKIHSCELACCC